MDNKVLDEAVEVAQRAWRELIVKDAPSSQEAMRAALLAGVKVLLGEPVAWQLRERFWDGAPWGDWITFASKSDRDVRIKLMDGWLTEARDVYAPSLGEGDGR